MHQKKALHLQDDKKIKEVGEEIADAASDNEPWFEPEQFMEMFPGGIQPVKGTRVELASKQETMVQFQDHIPYKDFLFCI